MSAKKKSTDDPVKPQVIDLGPEDITVQPDTSATPEPEIESNSAAEEPRATEFTTPPAKSKHKTGYALPLAALVAGLLGGGWLYHDLLSAYFPANEVTELTSRLVAAEIAVKSGAEKSLSLEQQIANFQTEFQKLSGTAANREDVASLQTGAQDSTARLNAAEASITKTQRQLDDIRSSIASLSVVPGTARPVDDTALANIRQRLDAVEQELAALKTAKPALSPSAELTQALSALRQKVSAGTSFSAELATLKSLEPDIQLFSDLESQASTGLPNAAALAQELSALAEKLPAAGPPPQEDNSYGSWIAKNLSGLITIKTIGEPDWPTLAKQSAAEAASGNLQEAVAYIDEAEGAKPPELMAWRDRANARVSLDATLSRLSDAVMQRIAEKG